MPSFLHCLYNESWVCTINTLGVFVFLLRYKVVCLLLVHSSGVSLPLIHLLLYENGTKVCQLKSIMQMEFNSFLSVYLLLPYH